MGAPKKVHCFIAAASVFMSLYGIIDMTAASKSTPLPPDLKAEAAQLREFLTQSAGIARNMPRPFDVYVTDHAGGVWGQDPFSGGGWTEEKSSVSRRPSLVYNGCVEGGSRAVAVINNVEYVVGDQLEEKGFFVKRILPSRVLIEDRNDGSQFEVPLSE